MFDISMLDPNVVSAMKGAGLDHIEDLNFNGKLDIQDVALMKAKAAHQLPADKIEPVKIDTLVENTNAVNTSA